MHTKIGKNSPRPNPYTAAFFVLFALSVLVPVITAAVSTAINRHYIGKIKTANEAFYIVQDCRRTGHKDCSALLADYQEKDREVREWPCGALNFLFHFKD